MSRRSEPLLRIWRPLAALVLTALLAACQGGGYLQNGIGSDLEARDIDSSTRSQEVYFNHLCRQAGIGEYCQLPLYDAGGWTLVVQQGMNDIDRRCDAYLQWLDDKKRSRGPWLSQVKDVQSATAALIGVFDPSNAIALQVVAQAFNLVTRSIENYHSRLLMEIDQSTINSVVLRARHDFRVSISERAFRNRPEAEYALRSYLRLCLPFAIETNINNYTTLASQGIPLSESNSINQVPVVGRQLLRDAPEGGGSVVRRTEPPPPPPFDTLALTSVEKSFRQDDISRIQRKLCVTPSRMFDRETRGAILAAESAIPRPAPNDTIDTGTERDILLAEPDGCRSSGFGFASVFEKFHFRSNATTSRRERIKQFQKAAYVCVGEVEAAKQTTYDRKPAEAAFVTGTLDDETRRAVSFLAPNLIVEGAAASPLPLDLATIESVETCRF